MSKANPFPKLMRASFYEWLVEQRNASVHRVRSYRDTGGCSCRSSHKRAERSLRRSLWPI
ncbi:hypothetical protein [Mesorhizobium sp. M0895]|uniref:hypothetical protein n=1 Tax=Mesorhizobium sp. M0895 TaxID=2957019 RepID=UPI0033383891